MKGQYEDRTRLMLPRRTHTILRVDGKAFHSYTRGCDKPYDERLACALDYAAMQLCREAQGSCFAYLQSDEISVLLTDFTDIRTEAWFDGNLQKIVSVAASVVTEAMNRKHGWHGRALFDCRAFTIPDPVEVENYFIWRQQDATRNSISSLAQAHFSHKQLHGKNNSEMQEMLFAEKGINWNDQPDDQKRGRCAIYTELGGWLIDPHIPVFTADREYLRTRMSFRQVGQADAPVASSS